MITKEQFIAKYVEIEAKSKKYLNDSFTEYEKVVLNTTDPEERKKNLGWLKSLCFNYEHYENQIKVDKVYLGAAYNDMIHITETLGKAFECEWISDTEFAVKTKHDRLSDFCYMLADWFGIESTSGFAFSSSFTTHNAKTKNNLGLNITCTKDGRGLLQFGLNPRYPYWVPYDIEK